MRRKSFFEADPNQGAHGVEEATASSNIHDIMGGLLADGNNGDEELHSPAHKCGGSRKLSTRRSAHKVSPPEEAGTNKSITFSVKKAVHPLKH
jgi:hypothetical protein